MSIHRAQFRERVVFQYAVKFVCGKSDGQVVVPGLYCTAINVHNPTYESVRFAVKAAIALPGLRPGPVSGFREALLGPDEALEIDCPDVRELLRVDADFLKGFVVIESEVELDVVAVYTAAGRDGQVSTLHTERVPARTRIVGGRPICIDFEPPFVLNTRYGAPAGHSSGDVVFVIQGVQASVHDFQFAAGGGTFNEAFIDVAPAPLGFGQSLRINNIDMEFDYAALPALPTEVRFDFFDSGGSENLSVNGSPVFAGELTAAPSPVGGVNVSVTSTPAPGGIRGMVILSGPVQRFRVGGQELWIDNVCAR